MPKLIVFAGLPASGKSTIARAVAARTGAVWLRVDTMDQAIWASGTAPQDLQDWTYRAAQAVAEDNLRLGRDVIGDCVNDWQGGRDGWQAVAERTGAQVVWLEVICSDAAEHRHRVETRDVGIPGLPLPDWQAIQTREHHPWNRDRTTIDTAGRSIAACIKATLATLVSA